MTTAAPVSTRDLARWQADGFLVVRELWEPDEITACAERFAAITAAGDADPRALGPRRGQRRSAHPLPAHHAAAPVRRAGAGACSSTRAIEAVLAALMEEQPIAAQSMFYFKPPGSKGQALHQDNYYLRVRPYTCIAAWTAVDRSVPENGGLYVCPGTHTMEVACPEVADPEESFTTHFVRPPAGIRPVPVELAPGDVLFFGGSIVHGSRPNVSAGEWRRSFICHYVPASFREMSLHYRPALRFDGREYEFADASGGGPCGTAFADGLVPGRWEEVRRLGLRPAADGSVPGA